MKLPLLILFFSSVVAFSQSWCWQNFAGSLTSDGDVDGTGTGAVFTQLYGIDINGAGDTLFVCDRGSGKIKKITVPGAEVTTLVSGLDLVQCVVNKVNGNVYFGNTGSTIHKLTPPGYTNVTTVATGISAYGLGIDSASDTLYVAGQSNQKIWYIPNAGAATPGPLTFLAGSGATGMSNATLTTSSFSSPMGMAVVVSDGNTNIYVSDRDNHAIRRIDVGADSVTTVAGGSQGCTDGFGQGAQFNQPHNVVLGPEGNLYVCDQDNYTVRMVTLPGGVVSTIGGRCRVAGAAAGCLSNAYNGNLGQITMDNAGNIYTADRGSINAADHARVSKGTPPAAGTQPYITSINLLNAVNAEYCWSEFTEQGGAYQGAYGAAVDTSTGMIYVSALLSGKLSSLTPSGTATVLGALVPSPVELSVSTTTHNLYVGSLSSGVIKVSPPYSKDHWIPIDGTYSCFATAVDSATETVYAANTGGHVIRIIRGAGPGAVLAGSGTAGFLDGVFVAARFNSPCGLAVKVSDSNTNIYVADRNNNRIRHINMAAGTVTTLAGGAMSCKDGTGTAAGFVAPTGCTLGPDGHLYIADQDALTIRKVTIPDGVVTTIGSDCSVGFGNYNLVNGCGSAARFSNIGQVGVASDLTLYVADRSNSNIRKGTPPSSTLVQIDFTGGVDDIADHFVLTSSGVLSGNYYDVGADITQLGSGSFRATISSSGSVQFYRIKR
jgi:hypothetical protein